MYQQQHQEDSCVTPSTQANSIDAEINSEPQRSNDRTKDLVLPFNPCPEAGSGVHRWVFHAAVRCVGAGYDDEQAESLIADAMTRPPSPWNEVTSALAAARGERAEPSHRWPKRNEGRIAHIATAGITAAELEALSPSKPLGNAPQTETIVDALFPGNPLLCCGSTNSRFNTQTREEWRGRLVKRQFVVPSPMSAVTGVTLEGKESKHSLSNTGPRTFLVVEFDTGTTDAHASLLMDLSEYLPLALVVHSGGKSLHGWFYCAGSPEDRLLKFMTYAVSLGADPATWTRSQFVRMPDGLRDGRIRQRVLFFNAEAAR